MRRQDDLSAKVFSVSARFIENERATGRPSSGPKKVCGKPTAHVANGKSCTCHHLQAYFPNSPVAVATSFFARLLRFSSTLAGQKCVSRRGGSGHGGRAPGLSRTREIVSKNREKSAKPSMPRRAHPWNRSGMVTLLWQCRGLMARAFVLERRRRPHLAARSPKFA